MCVYQDVVEAAGGIMVTLLNYGKDRVVVVPPETTINQLAEVARALVPEKPFTCLMNREGILLEGHRPLSLIMTGEPKREGPLRIRLFTFIGQIAGVS